MRLDYVLKLQTQLGGLMWSFKEKESVHYDLWNLNENLRDTQMLTGWDSSRAAPRSGM